MMPTLRKKAGCTIILLFILILSLCLIDRSTALNFQQGSQTPQEDPYKVLGVKRTASDADIQKAYRQRARETHRECIAVHCCKHL